MGLNLKIGCGCCGGCDPAVARITVAWANPCNDTGGVSGTLTISGPETHTATGTGSAVVGVGAAGTYAWSLTGLTSSSPAPRTYCPLSGSVTMGASCAPVTTPAQTPIPQHTGISVLWFNTLTAVTAPLGGATLAVTRGDGSTATLTTDTGGHATVDNGCNLFPVTVVASDPGYTAHTPGSDRVTYSGTAACTDKTLFLQK